MVTAFAFIFVLGVLVFVHELGHFLVAKACGVGVYTFSLGFGRRVWGVEYKGTDYRLSLVPLGGYVKMVGQSDSLDDDERDAEMPTNANFNNHPLWHRFLIVLAGPVMNIVFAFAVAPMIYWTGIEEENWRSAAPVVGYIEAESAAGSAGLTAGDTIISINGETVASWLDLFVRGQMLQGKTVPVVALHGAHQLTWMQPVSSTEYLPDLLPFKYDMPARVGELMPGGSAANTGLKPGDLITAVDGQPVNQFPALSPLIQAAQGAPVILSVLRDGAPLAVTLTPQQDGERWLIGIARSDDTHIEKYGFSEGLQKGFEKAARLVVFSLDMVVKLCTGQLGMKTLGGPIMIAQAAGNAARQGFEYLLSLMIFISIQLGILNLLPIPVLDGGHLTLFTVEAIIRRPPNEKMVEWLSRGGFALLILLMLVATTNDLIRVFGPTFGHLLEWVQQTF